MSELFANIGRYTDLLPILLFIFLLVKRSKEINKGLWVIFFYCILVALNDNFAFKAIPETHYNIVFSIFTLVEYLCISLFLGFHSENKKFKKLLFILFIVFCVFIGLYFWFVPFNFIDSVPIGIETILVICFSVYFLYELVNNTNVLLYNTSEFWIITGLLIYLAGSFFIYLYANQVPEEELYQFFFVTFIFTTIKNLLISVGFYLKLKDPKSQNPIEYQPFLN